MEKVVDKVTDMLVPSERKENDDKLYGKDAAGTEAPLVSGDDKPFERKPAGLSVPTGASDNTVPMTSPLAQGHIQPEDSGDSEIENISAPAHLTGMTGQYVVSTASNVAEEELKKHGTAVGLASATMASGAVGEQNPQNCT